MTTVAEQYPARTDSNGTTWYRPVRRKGDAMSQWGWTALPEHADPSYNAPNSALAALDAADGPTYSYEITTTEEDTSMTKARLSDEISVAFAARVLDRGLVK